MSSTMMAPVEAFITLSFESVDDQSAILATENPVLRHRVDDEKAVLQWMTANAPKVLESHKPIMKRHGVWVITKTYTSRRCAVAVLSGRSSAITIGLSADVPGLLTLTPTSSWTKGRGNCSTEVHEDKEGVVVFMSGVYFRSKLLSSKLKPARDQSGQKDHVFRGTFVEPNDEADLDVEFELEIQRPDDYTFDALFGI
ncbi:hypothetical protein PG991_001731 [Apiospora marii]|uniref:Uncharacterized protein n=1 Tax=Apiospora marii TaxID=335849 RepID=A0ABR1SQJ0_9PEZI